METSSCRGLFSTYKKLRVTVFTYCYRVKYGKKTIKESHVIRMKYTDVFC